MSGDIERLALVQGQVIKLRRGFKGGCQEVSLGLS